MHVSVYVYDSGCVRVYMSECMCKCESERVFVMQTVYLYSLDPGTLTHPCLIRPPAVRSGDDDAALLPPTPMDLYQLLPESPKAWFCSPGPSCGHFSMQTSGPSLRVPAPGCIQPHPS